MQPLATALNQRFWKESERVWGGGGRKSEDGKCENNMQIKAFELE